MTWTSDEAAQMVRGPLEMEARSILKNGIWLSGARMKTPSGTVSTRGCILGAENTLGSTPAYVEEAPAVRALRPARRHLETAESQGPKLIMIRAGGPPLTRKLLNWFNGANLDLKSIAAVEIVATIEDLSHLLPRPLIFSSVPAIGGCGYAPDYEELSPDNVIDKTHERFFSHALRNLEVERWRATAVGIPLASALIGAVPG